MKDSFSLFGWLARLPLAFVLCEWDAIPAVLVTHADENGLTLASDEHIFFFVHCHTFLRENGNSSIVRDFTHTHERLWEIGEGVGVARFWRELVEWKGARWN